jgi:hypothetical protein
VLQDRGKVVRFPAEARDSSLMCNVCNDVGAHEDSNLMDTRTSFPGVKVREREYYPSLPSSA